MRRNSDDSRQVSPWSLSPLSSVPCPVRSRHALASLLHLAMVSVRDLVAFRARRRQSYRTTVIAGLLCALATVRCEAQSRAGAFLGGDLQFVRTSSPPPDPPRQRHSRPVLPWDAERAGARRPRKSRCLRRESLEPRRLHSLSGYLRLEGSRPAQIASSSRGDPKIRTPATSDRRRGTRDQGPGTNTPFRCGRDTPRPSAGSSRRTGESHSAGGPSSRPLPAARR